MSGVTPERVRRLQRLQGDPIVQDVSLQPRDGTVRATLLAAAFDAYEEVPSEVRQYYDPKRHAIVIDLPDPQGER